MPSPIGHTLAGLSVAWIAAPRARRSLAIACAILAGSADVDVLFGGHRGPTHSLGAVAVVCAAVALVASVRKLPIMNTAGLCALAYSTHLVLDWLGKDTALPYGVMVLWPFSSRYFSSGADVFSEISRRYWRPEEFIFGNLRSLCSELVLLLPVIALAWWMKRRNPESRIGR